MQILCTLCTCINFICGAYEHRKYLQGVCTYCTVCIFKNHAVLTNTGKYNATDVLKYIT
jgi:hypothetical protein